MEPHAVKIKPQAIHSPLSEKKKKNNFDRRLSSIPPFLAVGTRETRLHELLIVHVVIDLVIPVVDP